jgi:uncharacterized protein with GYD domain
MTKSKPEKHNYILLTRMIREEVHPSFSMVEAERRVVDEVAATLPEVRWTASFATMGPWDYVDIFEAPDNATAMKVSLLVRHHGGAHTEVWPATQWAHFKGKIKNLASAGPDSA